MESQKGQASTLHRARIKTAYANIVIALLLFGSAGDLSWWPAWAYVAILAASSFLPLCAPLGFDEGLLEERMSKKPNAKHWDRYFIGLISVFTAAELIVPGLDHRFLWTKQQHVWIQLAGLALVVLGTAGLIWAMRTNRFFSAVIRIQTDRGHHVVSEGPYGIVRHPGYAFWSLRTVGVPLLFGSNWAFIVAGLFIAMFVVRTALEDRVLKEELPGYRGYAQRVRWKLVRGIW